MGLLARDHLMVLLRRVMARGLPRANGDAGQDDIAFEDLSRHFVSAAARSLILEQQLAVLQVCQAPVPSIQQSWVQHNTWLLNAIEEPCRDITGAPGFAQQSSPCVPCLCIRAG